MPIPMPNQLGISVTSVVNQHSCPKRAIVNLVEQVEREAKVENEDDVGLTGADPYYFTPNEIQDDEEGVALERDLLVIQRLLLTPRKELND